MESIKAAILASIGDRKHHRVISYLTWAALAVALGASILSALGICSSACTDAEKYRILGFHFATIGIPFFLTLFATSVGRNSRYWEIRCPYDGLLFGIAGAEWFFINLQRFLIGHYCPLCMTVAVSVYVAVALRLAELVTMRKRTVSKTRTRQMVASFVRGSVVFSSLFIGLITALAATHVPAPQLVSSITQDIWLGKTDSPIEVLFVSDWFCPYCRKAEPVVEKMLPVVEKVARCSFVDDPIHDASYEFMPYNMSLLLKQKDQYMEGRKVLLELAEKTRKPDEATVLAAFQKRGIKFSYADKAKLKELARTEGGFLRAHKVTMTPTIIVRNHQTGQHRVLVGLENMQEATVLAAVQSLATPKKTASLPRRNGNG